jgi:hypothetical protein
MKDSMHRCSRGLFLGIAGAMFLACACSPAPSSTAPPQTAGSAPVAGEADAGLAVIAPTRKGIMVPSDTGIGAGPPGGGSTTGTNGKALGPTMGNQGTGN